MDRHSWGTTLIVVRPDSPRIVKFRFTKAAILILALSALLAFLTVVAVERAAAPISMERERNRLQRENQELKLTNLNIATGKAAVEPEVEEMEHQAQRILKLLDDANAQ